MTATDVASARTPKVLVQGKDGNMYAKPIVDSTRRFLDNSPSILHTGREQRQVSRPNQPKGERRRTLDYDVMLDHGNVPLRERGESGAIFSVPGQNSELRRNKTVTKPRIRGMTGDFIEQEVDLVQHGLMPVTPEMRRLIGNQVRGERDCEIVPRSILSQATNSSVFSIIGLRAV